MNSVKAALSDHMQQAFRGLRYVPGHIDHEVTTDMTKDGEVFIGVSDADGVEVQRFTISIREHRVNARY